MGKFASAPVSKANGASIGFYGTEVSFYRDFRDTVEVRAPLCYVVDMDEATKDLTLILEDLTPARSGDQIIGCSVEEAYHAMDQAAA